jgi:RND family efflux transporter MFP subunit
MRRVGLASLVLAVLAVGFVAGAWVTWHASARNGGASARKVLYWVDPMHPSYRSDKPGIAPDCGMALEPVYADETPSTSSSRPANSLRVRLERQQVIGIEVSPVLATTVSRTIRSLGRVAVDENRVYRLVATAEGIVRSLGASAVGSFVRKEQVLLTFYSTDFLSAQQAYYYALTTLERVSADRQEAGEQLLATNAQLRSALDGLRNLGMSERQLVELGKTRKLTRDIELRSPATGYVLSRDVFPAQRLERGEELYRIADLSRVWVIVDVLEGDAEHLRPGTAVTVSLPRNQGPPMPARVADALPQYDRATGTFKVRIEVNNPAMALRPDMSVDVALPVTLPSVVCVPPDAIVDSGLRATVFVDRGEGYFEPRRVELGWRSDDQVEVVHGLSPGERIVVSGTFLLDSESRMRAAEMGINEPEIDLVCGMEVDRGSAKAAGRVSTRDGRTFYFCSDMCKKQFDAEPSKFVPKEPGSAPPPARAVSPPPLHGTAPAPVSRTTPPDTDQARAEVLARIHAADHGVNETAADADGHTAFALDPVCGAEVETAAPTTPRSTHRGTTYYFFSEACRAEFEKDPEKYAAKK